MSKKGAIVYYSWIGNTKMVAEELQRLTGYDLIPLIEKKPRPLGKVFGAVMGALFGRKSHLEPLDYTFTNYETLLLGAQIWAGKTTPAINAILNKGNFSEKKVHVFITMGDDKVPEKVFDSIRNRVEKKGGRVVHTLSLTTKWDPEVNKPVPLGQIQAEVERWVNQLGLF